jgi:uncharacterized protein (TIGR01777 family)
MTKVLVTGGTGSVGRRLCDFLSGLNFEVSLLSRSKNQSSPYKIYTWDHQYALIEKEAVEQADYIVHLAGAGIVDKKWTKSRKNTILQSRVDTTKLLHKVLSRTQHKVKAVIAASAVGYYGQTTSDHIFMEKDPPGTGFAAFVCKNWEREVQKINELGIRTVNLRFGIVLMEKGGALEKMAAPFYWNLGAPIGSGKQIIPWIHYKDLNKIIVQAMHSSSMTGPYNCCSPEIVTNREFSRQIAQTLGKKMWLPHVPEFIMRLILGERASLLLEGSAVSASKILSTGFTFNYAKLSTALSDLLPQNAS